MRNKKAIGKRIRDIRMDNNRKPEATMEEFGEMVGSKKSNVSRWERGENVPNHVTLRKIAALGDITVDELLYGKDKGCKYCKSEERLADMDKFHPLEVIIYDNVISLMWEEGSYVMEINFCPMCGSEVK